MGLPKAREEAAKRRGKSLAHTGGFIMLDTVSTPADGREGVLLL